MKDPGAFGDTMAEKFRLQHAQACSLIRTSYGSSFAVTRLSCGDEGLGRTLPIPAEPALVLVLMLRPLVRHELWLDGKPQSVHPWQEGGVSVVDLEQSPSAYIGSAADVVQFYLPKASLDAFSSQSGSQLIADLEIAHGTVDPVIHNLARLMLPALSRPREANRLFLTGLITALHGHLASTYSASPGKILHVRGGLSPKQLTRAKEMIAANLSGNVSLLEVAAACELSPAHFSRAFKRSTGVAPHQWLLLRRVEAAKQALLANKWRGAEVAGLCGFADQSHLIRVFSSLVGMTPKEWQRQHGRQDAAIDYPRID